MQAPSVLIRLLGSGRRAGMFGFMHVLAGAVYALEAGDRSGFASRMQSSELGFRQGGTGAWTWTGGEDEVHDQEARLPVRITTAK